MESQGILIPQERTACQEYLQCSFNPKVSCIALIVVFTLCSPVFCPQLCLKQQSTWYRLWLAEQGKCSFLSYFFSFPFSWQSTIQDWGEEVEEGAVYHVTLKRVQIQQAANKGARWLGVSKAGVVAFWKAAHGLWSLLNSTQIVTILTFSTDCSHYLKNPKHSSCLPGSSEMLSPCVDSFSFLDM